MRQKKTSSLPHLYIVFFYILYQDENLKTIHWQRKISNIKVFETFSRLSLKITFGFLVKSNYLRKSHHLQLIPSFFTKRTLWRQLLRQKLQDYIRTNQIPPLALLTIHFGSLNVAHPTTGTTVTLGQPTTNTPRMILMVAKQYSGCVILQTNWALCILETQIWSCIDRPFYLTDANCYRCFFRPLNLIELIVMSHSIGLANE